MRLAFRAVAYAGWALAFGLSVLLAIQLHQSKFSIGLGIAILALILSAFGLVMARYCWRDKDRTAATIGIVLWAAGALTFGITEFGFWYGSYKENYAEYVQVTKAKTRQEGLKDVAWEAVRTGETRANSAELEARINAAKQNEAWLTSGKCTNATQPKSRAFCQGYFELEAKLAAAGKLEALEKRLTGDDEDAAKESVVHNVFAAADLLAENFNLSNRQAATIVVAIIAVMLMLARDLLLLVANSFGSAAAARTASKSPKVTEVAHLISSPVQHRVERSESTPQVDLSRKVISETPPQPPKPDDTPPPGDVKPVEEVFLDPPKNPPAQSGPVLVGPDWKPAPKLSNKQRTALRKRRMREEVIEAVNEFATERLDTKSKAAKFIRTPANFVQEGGTPGVKIRKAFRTWAETSPKWSHLATYKDSPLGEIMCAVFKNGRPSKGGGAYYGVLLKSETRAVPRKKAALVAA